MFVTRGLQSLRQLGVGTEPAYPRVNHRFFQFHKDFPFEFASIAGQV